MLVNSSNTANAMMTGAIQQASQATGASFNYLLATAQVESGLNPQAGAATSSARGLFQFIDTTWLATIKQSGSALGLGRYADAITQTASGNYEVRDPTMRGEIQAPRRSGRQCAHGRSPRRTPQRLASSSVARPARANSISPISLGLAAPRG